MDTNKLDRVKWIDFAKGITILLVILGHTVGGIMRGMIFSFHMPFFFILSGITFKYSENGEMFIKKAQRAFRHLIIPVIVLYFMSTLIFDINYFDTFLNIESVKKFLQERVLVAVFSSGSQVSVLGAEIPALGMTWFLIVLYIGRTLFDYLNLKYENRKLAIICLILSVIGIMISKIQWLPLSFDIALAVLPFFVIGKNFNLFDVENNAFFKMIFSFCVWLILFVLIYLSTHTYMELACRRYTLFPLCYIVAVSGTLMISEFSVIACNYNAISKAVCYLGKNSLYMLCIHKLDKLLSSLWELSNYTYINALLRILVDIVLFILFMFAFTRIKKNIVDNL
jgi:fucose 4-O-acetylase-like acetyltransferase